MSFFTFSHYSTYLVIYKNFQHEKNCVMIIKNCQQMAKSHKVNFPFFFLLRFRCCGSLKINFNFNINNRLFVGWISTATYLYEHHTINFKYMWYEGVEESTVCNECLCKQENMDTCCNLMMKNNLLSSFHCGKVTRIY